METTTVSLAAIRRLTVSTQAYAPRFRRARTGDVEGAIRRLGAVQLDSITAVDRAHRLTLSSRIGAYSEQELQGLLTSGRVFEYWAHEACLLPIELWPHCRRTMEGGAHWRFHERAMREHRDLVEPVLERIREEGPLGARDFEGAGDGTEMWNWKPAKAVLEALWDRGVLAVAGRQSFQRRYDLAERVIPRAFLDAPIPDEDETLRTLALRAVRARGALTEPAVREHWRLKGGRARLHHHVLGLVDEGLLREVHPDDEGPLGGGPPEEQGPPVLCRRRGRARRGPGANRPPVPVRQPALGPPAARAALRLPPRDRGLQARARARVRLLRAAAARRRPDPGPRRPQGGPRGQGPPRAALPSRAARARERRCEARARGRPARSCARPGGGPPCMRCRWRRRAASRSARRGSTGRRVECSRPCAGSVSSSSTRSRPSRRRTTSSSGADSAPSTPPSSTGSSGKSGSSSSGARSSIRSRPCGCSGRSCGGATGHSTAGSSSGSRRVPLTAGMS